MSFKVWDVKSGDNYEFVHQALFTPRTLFIVTWDVSGGDRHIKDLEPWVYNIRVSSFFVKKKSHLFKSKMNKKDYLIFSHSLSQRSG